jgi:hypothetical protein
LVCWLCRQSWWTVQVSKCSFLSSFQHLFRSPSLSELIAVLNALVQPVRERARS